MKPTRQMKRKTLAKFNNPTTLTEIMRKFAEEIKKEREMKAFLENKKKLRKRALIAIALMISGIITLYFLG